MRRCANMIGPPPVARVQAATATITGEARTSATEAMATSISLFGAPPTGRGSDAGVPAETVSRSQPTPSGNAIDSVRDGPPACGMKPCGMAVTFEELLEIDI